MRVDRCVPILTLANNDTFWYPVVLQDVMADVFDELCVDVVTDQLFKHVSSYQGMQGMITIVPLSLAASQNVKALYIDEFLFNKYSSFIDLGGMRLLVRFIDNVVGNSLVGDGKEIVALDRLLFGPRK